ncbi:zinc-dependent alcohol dehydrogenase family protein [Rhodopila sp.]|uniref:zinc-dependent alcohol dehydrogenase family protein n=1 Tax=Rhodopila sp. TaxID=2480087 RepID=UPI002CD567D9|nr:NAD(P)-dependent alcohol dehydrogenase [Rhodopila sp.]HVZ10525.1 NAD(P)-dependent alcohol dehydrogenase [Rhodopila sp.]
MKPLIASTFMQAYHIPRATGIEALTLTGSHVPTPERGQVLVHMHAASLNYRDLMIVEGRAARGAPPENLIPLSDGAGLVIAVGPEVTRFKPGDRVAACFMQSWVGGPLSAEDGASALGGALDGVLAEYRLFDHQGLVRLPEHLSFEQGATLPCAAVTAWNALFGGQPLSPGDSVLVLGTGGVSVFALQFAVAAGFRVIATSSSDEKLDVMRHLGADHGVNYRRHPEWQEEVLRLTNGDGVARVVEVGGTGTLARSILATRLGGEIGMIGALTTGGEINPTTAMRRNLILRGIYVGSRQMFEAMNRAISAHRIEPVIDRVFPFAAAAEAYRHLKSQTHLGKVVIRISE